MAIYPYGNGPLSQLKLNLSCRRQFELFCPLLPRLDVVFFAKQCLRAGGIKLI